MCKLPHYHDVKDELCVLGYLVLFMYKQKGQFFIVNRRTVNTRAHDALLFTTKKRTMKNISKHFFIEVE